MNRIDIERAVMNDPRRPCLFHVAGPCFHPKCLVAHYATLSRADREHQRGAQGVPVDEG